MKYKCKTNVTETLLIVMNAAPLGSTELYSQFHLIV